MGQGCVRGAPLVNFEGGVHTFQTPPWQVGPGPHQEMILMTCQPYARRGGGPDPAISAS